MEPRDPNTLPVGQDYLRRVAAKVGSVENRVDPVERMLATKVAKPAAGTTDGSVLTADSTQPGLASWKARVLAFDENVASDYNTAGGTALTLASITLDGSTRIRLTAYGYCSNSTAAALCGFKVMDGATTIQDASSIRVPTAGMNVPVSISRVITPSAGSHTYSLVNCNPGAGVASIFGLSVGQFYLMAELL